MIEGTDTVARNHIQTDQSTMCDIDSFTAKSFATAQVLAKLSNTAEAQLVASSNVESAKWA